MRLLHRGGSPASAGGPLDPDRVRARIAGDVLTERRGSVVAQADLPTGRRLLVLCDPRMSRAKIAAELRALARRLEEAE